MSKSRYSVIIQWSEEDQVFVATLPEWGGCHTHGATYEEAARQAQEVLQEMIDADLKAGRELPSPHLFQHPGPSGFSYDFSVATAPRKVRHATA